MGQLTTRQAQKTYLIFIPTLPLFKIIDEFQVSQIFESDEGFFGNVQVQCFQCLTTQVLPVALRDTKTGDNVSHF